VKSCQTFNENAKMKYLVIYLFQLFLGDANGIMAVLGEKMSLQSLHFTKFEQEADLEGFKTLIKNK
jgi:hypothetical protein